MGFAKEYLEKLKIGLDYLDESKIEGIVDVLINALENNKQIFILGNGGSATTSSHFACDLSKGTLKRVYDKKEKRFRVISLVDNTALITALANDIGYDDIFVQQLSNLIQPGDVLIVFTGSGTTPNVIRAIEFAENHKAITIAFLGFKGGKIKDIVDYSIIFNDDHYGRIEDAHLILEHLICSWLREKLDSLKGKGGYYKDKVI